MYSVSSFRDNLRGGADASFDWLINKNRKLFKFEYVGLLKPLVSFSESPEVEREEGGGGNYESHFPSQILRKSHSPAYIFSKYRSYSHV